MKKVKMYSRVFDKFNIRYGRDIRPSVGVYNKVRARTLGNLDFNSLRSIILYDV